MQPAACARPSTGRALARSDRNGDDQRHAGKVWIGRVQTSPAQSGGARGNRVSAQNTRSAGAHEFGKQGQQVCGQVAERKRAGTIPSRGHESTGRRGILLGADSRSEAARSVARWLSGKCASTTLDGGARGHTREGGGEGRRRTNFARKPARECEATRCRGRWNEQGSG